MVSFDELVLDHLHWISLSCLLCCMVVFYSVVSLVCLPTFEGVALFVDMFAFLPFICISLVTLLEIPIMTIPAAITTVSILYKE